MKVTARIIIYLYRLYEVAVSSLAYLHCYLERLISHFLVVCLQLWVNQTYTCEKRWVFDILFIQEVAYYYSSRKASVSITSISNFAAFTVRNSGDDHSKLTVISSKHSFDHLGFTTVSAVFLSR